MPDLSTSALRNAFLTSILCWAAVKELKLHHQTKRHVVNDRGFRVSGLGLKNAFLTSIFGFKWLRGRSVIIFVAGTRESS